MYGKQWSVKYVGNEESSGEYIAASGEDFGQVYVWS